MKTITEPSREIPVIKEVDVETVDLNNIYSYSNRIGLNIEEDSSINNIYISDLYIFENKDAPEFRTVNLKGELFEAEK